MRKIKLLLAALALVASGEAARAQPDGAPRAEVPVREVVLSDGARRYAVPIRVGGTDLLAGLDSGSTGLRILPNVLADGDLRPTSRDDDYAFDAGVRLSGVVAQGAVSVGGLTGQTSVQLVRSVSCTREKPDCPGGALPLARYGVQGDGLPGEGFKAILGVNMADADVASLFAGIGARRWIIELPRPGETQPGRIVLNPTDEEVQGFISLPIVRAFANKRGGVHDAVAGCLINDATHARLCGAVLLDTGAPGIEVVGRDRPAKPWPPQTPATLAFADGDGHIRLAEAFQTDRRDHASHLTFQPQERTPMTLILSGLTPYFAYAVLYDPAHGAVGFRPRPPPPHGPVAVAVP